MELKVNEHFFKTFQVFTAVTVRVKLSVHLILTVIFQFQFINKQKNEISVCRWTQ